jgi:hypothetical protein
MLSVKYINFLITIVEGSPPTRPEPQIRPGKLTRPKSRRKKIRPVNPHRWDYEPGIKWCLMVVEHLLTGIDFYELKRSLGDFGYGGFTPKR